MCFFSFNIYSNLFSNVDLKSKQNVQILFLWTEHSPKGWFCVSWKCFLWHFCRQILYSPLWYVSHVVELGLQVQPPYSDYIVIKDRVNGCGNKPGVSKDQTTTSWKNCLTGDLAARSFWLELKSSESLLSLSESLYCVDSSWCLSWTK